jgi:hypothetical protein
LHRRQRTQTVVAAARARRILSAALEAQAARDSPGIRAARAGIDQGGGGGGGAAGGGLGGPGGAGSTNAGGAGGNGGSNGNGAGTPTISNGAPLIGGNGQAGESTGIITPLIAGGAGSGGGGGGAGGYGAVVTGGGSSSNISIISGGAGGAGGISGFGFGGSGGDGGVGVQFTASGATFTNSGSVIGGAGGAAGLVGAQLPGVAGGNGSAGLGGVGIVGAGLTIIDSGVVGGGLSGGGNKRANAITFTGGSNVLELQSGFAFLGNVVDQTGNGTLRLGGATGESFDVSTIGATGQFQGFANFVKTGTSTWTLAGSSALAMSWTVQQGTLSVGVALGDSSFTVNNNGTLTGIGSVGATQVNAGGTFAPGSGTPGTSMTVSGTLAFQSAANYLVQVNSITSSLANVTGTATLGGATVNAVFSPGGSLSKQYTILTAGSLGGTFDPLVNSNLLQSISETLSYDATHVFLNLALNFSTPSGLSGNQQAVGTALANFFNVTGSIPFTFAALSPTGLTLASGEGATASQQATFDAMSQFIGLLTDPFAGRGNGIDGATTTPGYADENASAYAAAKGNNDAFAMFTKAPPAAFASLERVGCELRRLADHGW